MNTKQRVYLSNEKEYGYFIYLNNINHQCVVQLEKNGLLVLTYIDNLILPENFWNNIRSYEIHQEEFEVISKGPSRKKI